MERWPHAKASNLQFSYLLSFLSVTVLTTSKSLEASELEAPLSSGTTVLRSPTEEKARSRIDERALSCQNFCESSRLVARQQRTTPNGLHTPKKREWSNFAPRRLRPPACTRRLHPTVMQLKVTTIRSTACINMYVFELLVCNGSAATLRASTKRLLLQLIPTTTIIFSERTFGSTLFNSV